MIKKITLLIIVATLSSTIIVAQSFTALYTFDSVKTSTGLIDPTAVPTSTGVVFGSFSSTGVSANPNASGRFSFTGWPLGATAWNDVYSQLIDTLSATQYYEVTVTPSSGFTIALSSITFNAQRSGTGIRTYAVRSSADSYAANLPASINPANPKLSVQAGDVFFVNTDSTTTSQTGSTITLSGTDFTNITSAVTFRFYAWNAEGTGGTFGIDNVSLSGIASQATSITGFSEASAISVYPNPSANGLLTVDLGSYTGKKVITVYNIIGKIIFSKEINSSLKNEKIDLSNEANGSYFVNIKNDKENSTKKITIIK